MCLMQAVACRGCCIGVSMMCLGSGVWRVLHWSQHDVSSAGSDLWRVLHWSQHDVFSAGSGLWRELSESA